MLKFKLFFKLHYIKKSQDQIKYMDTLRIFRGATSFRRVLYLSNHRERRGRSIVVFELTKLFWQLGWKNFHSTWHKY